MSWPTYERVIVTRGDIPHLLDMRAGEYKDTAVFDLTRSDDAVTPTFTTKATLTANAALRANAATPVTARATVLTGSRVASAAPAAPAGDAGVAPAVAPDPLMSHEWYRRARLEQMALRAKGRAAR